MDGDYLDVYEYACYGKGSGNITGNIRIPNDVWNGNTSIRVAISTEGYPAGPCDDILSGEIEDYTIKISGASDRNPTNTPRGGLYVHMPSRVNMSAAAAINIVPKPKKSSAREQVNTPTIAYEVSIYPNPSITTSTVVLNAANTHVGYDHILITDTNGRTIRNINIMSLKEKAQIDTRTLSPGIYYVTVIKDGNGYTEKLLVTR